MVARGLTPKGTCGGNAGLEGAGLDKSPGSSPGKVGRIRGITEVVQSRDRIAMGSAQGHHRVLYSLLRGPACAFSQSENSGLISQQSNFPEVCCSVSGLPVADISTVQVARSTSGSVVLAHLAVNESEVTLDVCADRVSPKSVATFLAQQLQLVFGPQRLVVYRADVVGSGVECTPRS